MGSVRTLVICLDGATWDVIDPLLEGGKLPCISRLVRGGVSGTLESVNPSLSAAAWVSFMTGKNPGKHGVFDFLWQPPNPYLDETWEGQIVSSTCYEDHATLFDILTVNTKKIGVVNLPITYPPWAVNGFMVTGFLTPDRATCFTWPPGLGREIVENIKGYEVDIKFGVTLGEDNRIRFDEHEPIHPFRERVMNEIRGADTLQKKKRSLLGEAFGITNIRTETILYLVRTFPDLDFLLTYFRELDVIQHFFWDRKDILRDYYCFVDRQLERIIRAFGNTLRVFVISDHGFGASETMNFNVNRLLLEKGHLHVTTGAPGMSLHRLRLVCKRHLRILRHLFPRDTRTRMARRASFPSVDFSKTIAYGMTRGGVYGIDVNVEGRNAGAGIKRSEYEKTRDEVIRLVQDVNGLYGDGKMIKWVGRKEEIYAGHYLDKVPDVVIIPDPRYSFSLLMDDRIVTAKTSGSERTGTHRQQFDGIFIANGPDLKSGERLSSQLKLLDVTPTLLFLLGCAIDADMDGRVLSEILSKDSSYLTKEPQYRKYSLDRTTCETVLSEGDERVIKSRLQGLGYI